MAEPRLTFAIKAVNQASAALREVQSDLRGMADTAEDAGGRFDWLGGAIRTMAVAGAAATAALGGAVAWTGTQFLGMKEQTLLAFETMLGSGERARQMFDDLAAFAARTPFEMPGLLRATQQLLAYGFAAEDVIPILRRVGDAAAGLGAGEEGVARIVRALGQMEARGKAAAGELLQLTEVGVPAWRYLAEAMGKSVSEVMDMVSKGQIDAQTAINAILAGMERDFSGLMEKQSRTFSGLLSTAKDTFAQLSATVMEPFFGLMTRGLERLTELLSSDAAAGAARRLAEGLAEALSTVGRLFESFMQGLQGDTTGKQLGTLAETAYRLGQALRNDVLPAVREFGERFGAAVVEAVRGFGQILAENKDAILALAEALFRIAVNVGEFAGKVAASLADVIPWRDVLSGAKDALGALLGGLRSILTPVADFANRVSESRAAVEAVTPIIAGLTAAFLAYKAALIATATYKAAVTAATQGLAAAQAVLNAVMSANPIGLVVLALAGLAAALVTAYRESETFRAFVDAAFRAVADAAMAVVGWFTGTFVPFFTETVPGAFEDLRARLTDIWNGVKSFLQSNWQEILSIAATILLGPAGLVVMFTTNAFDIRDKVTGAFTELKDRALGLFTELKDQAIGLVTNLRDGAVGAVTELRDRVVGVATELRDQASSLFGELRDRAVGVAGELRDRAVGALTELRDGVIGLFGELRDRVIGALGDLRGGAESKFVELLGWAAALPSRLLGAIGDIGGRLWSVGWEAIQGLARGMGDAVGAAVAAATEAANKVVNAVKDVFDLWSPSRVFVDLGRNVAEGLRLGIEQRAWAAERTAAEMAAAAAAAAVAATPPREGHAQHGQGPHARLWGAGSATVEVPVRTEIRVSVDGREMAAALAETIARQRLAWGV